MTGHATVLSNGVAICPHDSTGDYNMCEHAHVVKIPLRHKGNLNVLEIQEYECTHSKKLEPGDLPEGSADIEYQLLRKCTYTPE